MKNLILILWFVLFLSSSALAGVEYVTEEVCHAMSGCWMDTKTGECPDCVIEEREVVHTHEETLVIVEKPVVVEKPFVEPKRTFWTPKKTSSKKTCDISILTRSNNKACNRLKVKAWLKKKTVKKEGNWTCVVGPCDFIDENGNLIEKS
jgi:hypothetical protein